MTKKYPLCAILKPAPWQEGLDEGTEPSTRPEIQGLPEETQAIDEATMKALVWDAVGDTPTKSKTEVLALNMRELTRKVPSLEEKTTAAPNFEIVEDLDEDSSPFTSTEVWDVDLWSDD